eukprot:1158733-Pelagomonas_calceolata.AAC.2
MSKQVLKTVPLSSKRRCKMRKKREELYAFPHQTQNLPTTDRTFFNEPDGLAEASEATHFISKVIERLASCQNHSISDRKSFWGAGLVNTDMGSNDRLLQHNL